MKELFGSLKDKKRQLGDRFNRWADGVAGEMEQIDPGGARIRYKDAEESVAGSRGPDGVAYRQQDDAAPDEQGTSRTQDGGEAGLNAAPQEPDGGGWFGRKAEQIGAMFQNVRTIGNLTQGALYFLRSRKEGPTAGAPPELLPEQAGEVRRMWGFLGWAQRQLEQLEAATAEDMANNPGMQARYPVMDAQTGLRYDVNTQQRMAQQRKAAEEAANQTPQPTTEPDPQPAQPAPRGVRGNDGVGEAVPVQTKEFYYFGDAMVIQDREGTRYPLDQLSYHQWAKAMRQLRDAYKGGDAPDIHPNDVPLLEAVMSASPELWVSCATNRVIQVRAPLDAHTLDTLSVTAKALPRGRATEYDGKIFHGAAPLVIYPGGTLRDLDTRIEVGMPNPLNPAQQVPIDNLRDAFDFVLGQSHIPMLVVVVNPGAFATQNPGNMGVVAEAAARLEGTPVTIILLSPPEAPALPAELGKQKQLVLGPPGQAQTAQIIQGEVGELGLLESDQVLDQALLGQMVSAVLGLGKGDILTLIRQAAHQADTVFHLPDLLQQERAASEGSDMFRVSYPKHGEVSQLVGLETYIEWFNQRRLAGAYSRRPGLADPVIFTGPAGTGKTELVRYLAAMWDCPLITCDLGAVTDSLLGQTEQNYRQLLAQLRQFATQSDNPVFVLFDEIEKFLDLEEANGNGSSGNAADRALTAVKGYTLQFLADIKNGKIPGMVLVGTANIGFTEVADFYRTRFHLMDFRLPTRETAKQIWNVGLTRQTLNDPDGLTVEAPQLADGQIPVADGVTLDEVLVCMAPRDILNIARAAAVHALSHRDDLTSPPQIKAQDVMAVLPDFGNAIAEAHAQALLMPPDSAGYPQLTVDDAYIQAHTFMQTVVDGALAFDATAFEYPPLPVVEEPVAVLPHPVSVDMTDMLSAMLDLPPEAPVPQPNTAATSQTRIQPQETVAPKVGATVVEESAPALEESSVPVVEGDVVVSADTEKGIHTANQPDVTTRKTTVEGEVVGRKTDVNTRGTTLATRIAARQQSLKVPPAAATQTKPEDSVPPTQVQPPTVNTRR